MRNTFIKYLIEQARTDERIFVVTPDLGFSVLEGYAQEFPNRFLNVGIAEQNAIGVAAGLALSGKIVYVYSIIPFVTMRCFEQIRIDVAYMKTNVRLVGVGAGLSYGPAGATHHAIEDIAIMRALPNMIVCCPGDPIEVREIVKRSFEHTGPIYIRLGKNGEPQIHPDKLNFQIGNSITITEGSDIALITTGNMLDQAMRLVKFYQQQGKKIELLSVPTIKPFDTKSILYLIDRKIPIITLEEHNAIGGLGSTVAEVIAISGIGIPFKKIAINDQYSHYVGSQNYLREKFGLSERHIIKIVDQFLASIEK
jgi:transketolase